MLSAVAEARETIKNGMTFERTLFPNFVDEFTFRLDHMYKTYFDQVRSVIAETARHNPRAKYCGVNCRTSDYYRRKRRWALRVDKSQQPAR